MTATGRRIFITGVSRGIGKELALYHLENGDHVYGVSRFLGDDFSTYTNFHHLGLDLSETDLIPKYLNNFFESNPCTEFSRVYLNAGLIDDIYFLNELNIEKFNYILSVNLAAYKQVLDFFINHKVIDISEVVVSSSIAGVRARAGMSAYAVSKAALNMLMKIYALENPSIFIVVAGLCIFDSAVSQVVTPGNTNLKRFKELQNLANRLNTPKYMVSAKERSMDLIFVLDHLVELGVSSGDFFEIREILKI
ncbi:SDR family NAD(P)-dependent oxidoreductase [Serratia inhibens]|uniref:SDR family NAD(P)-dependent oxidoreductase n=1 Tax=Serratia inhibens TaxID=2338073 RepID=A0AA92X2D7_9GAMM|nr:SDR family NAD(P)-dependent oxidoreductase [Serratia inhibens]ANS41502.1 Benzil reductase ((S)-benzoin forming) [Serratia inhibens PRI-2C]RJF54797.1 SDR family NAD(P)-dependent oxidoreductase [Serratia inhibens]